MVTKAITKPYQISAKSTSTATLSKSAKYLGIWIDNNLRFNLHAKETIKKATKIMGML